MGSGLVLVPCAHNPVDAIWSDRPAPPAGKGDIAPLLAVQVTATDTCLRYAAAMVENVRIKPSPRWLRQRLRHAGVRPINNIVDITNYVMLEYGQPMHAFDYAYVNGGKITVRMARDGEKIVTLDNAERPLDAGMMIIADEKGPIAVAGVMGGEFSGVYETTQRVVFESACFDGPSVRATSKRLGLRTESSTRFEKGLDPSTASPALRRALELVAELDAGDIVGGILDDYPAPRESRSIPLRAQAINSLLGIEVTEKEMVDILLPLGFTVQNGQVGIPTARADVARDCDLAEASRDSIVAQLTNMEKNLTKTLGYEIELNTVRYPFGSGRRKGLRSAFARAISEAGYVHAVLWDVDTTKLPVSKIMRQVKNGSIVLLHANNGDLKKMTALLPLLKEKGFEMVTVSQLLGLTKTGRTADAQ